MDISIHALLAESDIIKISFPFRLTIISIHALLAESDNLRVLDGSKSSIISIHALLAESDACITITIICTALFLSTLSLRRATQWIHYYWLRHGYFYPRSPCGERRFLFQHNCTACRISIHALLAESDLGRGEVV